MLNRVGYKKNDFSMTQFGHNFHFYWLKFSQLIGWNVAKHQTTSSKTIHKFKHLRCIPCTYIVKHAIHVMDVSNIPKNIPILAGMEVHGSMKIYGIIGLISALL